MKFTNNGRPRACVRGILILALAVASVSAVPPASSQPAGAAKPAAAKGTTTHPAVFASPQAAVDALIGALRAADAGRLASVLGPGHTRITDSGDSVADRAEWARFVAAYDAKHSLQTAGDARATLIVGKDDWPMPIPLVRSSDRWAFDSFEGEQELLARRIGRNELDAIQVCLAFVDMQREYAEVDRDGSGILHYALRFQSTPGKRDGLYWPTKAGDPPSPGGPMLAEASAQRTGKAGPQPYHGYFYRMLTAQGRHAPGGARDYLVNGKLIGGAGLVAYPAKYGNSGVKTFICNMDGIVYEKDFGTDTATLVAKIRAYDPDPTWEKAN